MLSISTLLRLVLLPRLFLLGGGRPVPAILSLLPSPASHHYRAGSLHPAWKDHTGSAAGRLGLRRRFCMLAHLLLKKTVILAVSRLGGGCFTCAAACLMSTAAVCHISHTTALRQNDAFLVAGDACHIRYLVLLCLEDILCLLMPAAFCTTLTTSLPFLSEGRKDGTLPVASRPYAAASHLPAITGKENLHASYSSLHFIPAVLCLLLSCRTFCSHSVMTCLRAGWYGQRLVLAGLRAARRYGPLDGTLHSCSRANLKRRNGREDDLRLPPVAVLPAIAYLLYAGCRVTALNSISSPVTSPRLYIRASFSSVRSASHLSA